MPVLKLHSYDPIINVTYGADEFGRIVKISDSDKRFFISNGRWEYIKHANHVINTGIFGKKDLITSRRENVFTIDSTEYAGIV